MGQTWENAAELLARAAELERMSSAVRLHLDCARWLREWHARRADFGWMMSMFPGSGGEILAVSSGWDLRKLQAEERELEHDLERIEIERGLVVQQLEELENDIP